MRRRALSIATKYSFLFAALFVYMAIVQYFCFHTLNLENLMRAAIVFAPTTILATGLALWVSANRNAFVLCALIVPVMLSFLILAFATFYCLDVRWIDHRESGGQFHQFVTSPQLYVVSYAVAGLLLWTGYDRLSRSELARQ